jgi:multidrug resistance efflux pump
MSGTNTSNKTILCFKKLQRLRNFNGESSLFFQTYLETILAAISSSLGFFAFLDSEKEWRLLASSKHQKINSIIKLSFPLLSKTKGIYPQKDGNVVIHPIIFDNHSDQCVFAAFLHESSSILPEESLSIISSLSDLYAQYKIRRHTEEALESKTQFACILEINLLINSSKTFQSAIMSLTGELSNRFHCERVSLGWVKNGYVVIKAISHTDSFEKKMEVVSDLEHAMEESMEQGACIEYPFESDKNLYISKAHEYYYKKHNSGYLLSVPIEIEGVILGILSFEREKESFSEKEKTLFSLSAAQIASPLDSLYHQSRWFGAKMAYYGRHYLSKVFGYQHTWIKLFSLIFVAFLLFATLVPIEYRVDAPAILMTDKIIYVTAPFDGYIDSVFVKPGDVLKKGQKIILLDQKQLQLEEADLMAEEQNYRREIQKAQANEQLAEMRIFQAKLSQVQAKLQTVRFKISQTMILSDEDNAVVIIGDLQKKIGAPVRTGEELFQLALIEQIYVEIDVDESEIENVNSNAHGVVAVKSKPDTSFSFTIQQINPNAVVKDQSNIFQVRGDFLHQTPTWFRPGMTGVAKIESAQKTLWWILTHKAIDYLRLKLWW